MFNQVSRAMKMMQLSPKTEKVIENCDWCLDNKDEFHEIIQELFDANVDTSGVDGNPGLSSSKVLAITPQVASKLKLPETMFADVGALYQLFDFDDDHALNLNETEKMYRQIIRTWREETDGRKDHVDVPFSSLHDKGYDVVKELGRGGQGAMYLCTKTDDSSKKYCIKFYEKADENAGGLDELIDEFTRMKELKHPNVARTYETFQDGDYLYLVNEPYFGKDLTHLGLQASNAGISMSENWWRGLFRQCLEGLAYLHGNALMHCDIKEPNIMIADADKWQEPRAVMIDFGLATPFSAEGGCSGTPGYMPPEVYDEEKWYPRGDVFSMGIVMFQLMTGRVENRVLAVAASSADADQDAMYGHLARSLQLPWAEFPSNMPQLRRLIESMTKKIRTQRPRAINALGHEWFNSNTDAPLPHNIREALIDGSKTVTYEEQITLALVQHNNLDEIRAIEQSLTSLDTNNSGTVADADFEKVLCDSGIDEANAKRYISVVSNGGRCPYKKLVARTLEEKSMYSEQYLRELFDDIDVDKNGSLSKEELNELLRGNGFECDYADVDEMMGDMDTDEDGMVSWEEFKRVGLQDGRISRRAEAGDDQWDSSDRSIFDILLCKKSS